MADKPSVTEVGKPVAWRMHPEDDDYRNIWGFSDDAKHVEALRKRVTPRWVIEPLYALESLSLPPSVGELETTAEERTHLALQFRDALFVDHIRDTAIVEYDATKKAAALLRDFDRLLTRLTAAQEGAALAEREKVVAWLQKVSGYNSGYDRGECRKIATAITRLDHLSNPTKAGDSK